MTNGIHKSVFVGIAILAGLLLLYIAYSRPWYFTSPIYLSGLFLLEFLVAAVWMYRRVFFPLVVVAFLFAGVNLPVGVGFWGAARWAFLAVGAWVGSLMVLKDRRLHFGLFHATAFFAVSTALMSVTISRYTNIALLKVLSILLLFVYASTGARIAVAGREDRFFPGLLAGCEIFVGANAVLYAVGIGAMGNPNSLGEVMGGVCAPLLLWGALLGGKPFANRRRWVCYAICAYMTYFSHARAGMAAALVSSGALLLALRRYKLLTTGLIIITVGVGASAIFRPEAFSALVSSMTSTVYKGHNEDSVLTSRITPWQTAINNIREHPWFGMGLGTTASGQAEGQQMGYAFRSNSNVTTENGSSYLSLTVGVGVFGVLPFVLLFVLLLGKILRTLTWMWRFGNPSHQAIPLAMIVLAGIVHAGFEDWMFAPGNYMCVFFWSIAFIFADLAPSSAVTYQFIDRRPIVFCPASPREA